MGNVRVLRNDKFQWGVVDDNNNEIVPFGKYSWIDTFDSGLARVNNKIMKESAKDSGIFIQVGANWGIINANGEEVLPVEYDSVWKFAGKNRNSTKVVKNGKSKLVYFDDLLGISDDDDYDYDPYYEDGYRDNYYDNYTLRDSYNDAFDGFADAYWNID